MVLIPYTDVHAFSRDVMDPLARNEVENNLPLGILKQGVECGSKADWFMARVSDGSDENELVALMTPPYNLMLASPGRMVPVNAARILAEHLVRNRIPLPGVLAEKELSLAFAHTYSVLSGKSREVATEELLYRLDCLESVPLVGTLRPASDRDMHFLPYWMKCFTDECFRINSPLDVENARLSVEHGTMYILEDGGQPVSMAGSTRQMPHGRTVGPVYTPPHFRNRGYATASVALLTRILLDKGNDYCALFADHLNPVSNGVYRKIGYQPLCDFTEVRFT